MARDLKHRLAQLRSAGFGGSGRGASPELPAGPDGVAPAPAAAAALPPPRRRLPGRGGSPPCLADWERAGDLVWMRELQRPLAFPETIDPLPFSAFGSLRRLGAAGGPSGERIPAEALRFFDLETTGLSGGSGTLAFLAAVGRLSEGCLAITQFFLEDFPGERLWLELLSTSIPPGAVLVTYNGRAFDLPLLRSRCVMNGLSPPDARHIDALPCSRRLWRRIHGGASLGLLERRLLDFERGEDLCAAAIPGVWFSFLRESDSPLMAAVMSHNADDIEGLAALVASIRELFENPTALPRPLVDLDSLGRTLVAMGREAEGAAVLRSAFEGGDETAGLRLSNLYRRAGRRAERRKLLANLPLTCRSCVERAKFCEHVEREWVEALKWTLLAQELAEAGKPGLRSSLERRRRRLERLLSKDGNIDHDEQAGFSSGVESSGGRKGKGGGRPSRGRL
ncbi:MAG: ribonuclease H-like domain-containing protein [Treponema sp.]|nr:ribonuclease H-like domain-containing protein [Treponema sp.]